MSWSTPHLIDIDDLSVEEIDESIALATAFHFDLSEGRGPFSQLAGQHVALLFAEPSTRTRLSFELAARRLGAETYVLEPISSSMVKGETLVDTVRNLDALGFSMLVVRHHRAGSAAVAARYFGGNVVNAGDGWHAHPTQALLDLFTLQRRARRATRAEGRDRWRRSALARGEVQRSDADASRCRRLAVRAAEWVRGLDSLAATVTTDLDAALSGADAVMGLRVQKERMAPGLSLDEYIARYQITEQRLARTAPDARYLHPGPINEGVEVTREVCRGPRSLVLDQARNGVPVRMAVLSMLARVPGRDCDPA